jgi:prepilin-type N-terminal cleavage/methylation domain-containing protein
VFSKKNLRGDEGFTLYEVLAAMIILAVGMLALEAMGIGAARAVAKADLQSEYTAVASTEVERLVNEIAQNRNPASGSSMVDGASVARVITRGTSGGRDVFTVSVTVTPPHNRVNLQSITVVGRASR